MRIAYVLDLVAEHGVASKTRSQLRVWRRDGHEAEAFFLAPADAREFEPPGSAFHFSSWKSRVLASRRLAAAVARFRPELVYIRYDLFFPPVWRIARRYVSAIEVNTNDVAELHDRSRVTRVFNRVNRRMLLRNAGGLVAVTHELAELERGRGFAGKVLVLGNGIDLGPMRPTTEVAPPDYPLRVVFVGLRRPWHGLDRVLELASEMPQVAFDIVGAEEEPGAATPKNVTFHGVLAPRSFDHLLQRAHVGLGPLALERKAMREACPLKVREYLAHGLPVVMAGTDPDLTGEGLWFVLQLPVENWDPSQRARLVRTFLEHVAGRRVRTDEVRDRIDIEVKERARLEFLADLVSSSATPTT